MHEQRRLKIEDECLNIDVRSRIVNIMWRAKFKVKDIVDRLAEGGVKVFYCRSTYMHTHATRPCV